MVSNRLEIVKPRKAGINFVGVVIVGGAGGRGSLSVVGSNVVRMSATAVTSLQVQWLRIKLMTINVAQVVDRVGDVGGDWLDCRSLFSANSIDNELYCYNE